MQQLLADSNRYQTEIEQLLEKYNVQPVGNGYIDLILPRNRAIELIKELSQVPVVVESLSWWCLCTSESKLKLGCPHGMGGPSNKFGEGWFSECGYFFDLTGHNIEFDSDTIGSYLLAKECSEFVCNYLENILPLENFYSECLHPGLWLRVPDNWQRQRYFLMG